MVTIVEKILGEYDSIGVSVTMILDLSVDELNKALGLAGLELFEVKWEGRVRIIS